MYRIVHCSVIVVQAPSIEDRRYTLFWDRVSLHLDGDDEGPRYQPTESFSAGNWTILKLREGVMGAGGLRAKGGGR